MQRTMRARSLLAAFLVAAAAAVAGCSGGSSTPPPLNTGTATPTPVPTATPPATSASGTLTTSTSASTSLTLGPIGSNGNTGTVRAGASNPATALNVTFSLTQPANVPTPSAFRRMPQSIGGANLSFIAWFQVTANPGTTLPSWPGFSFTFGASQTLPDPAHSYVAEFDPSNAAAGWTTIEGPASAAGTVFTWTAPAIPVTLTAGNTYTFVLFSTSSTLATPTPTPAPTASPSPSPTPSPTPAPPGTLTTSSTQVSMTAAGQTAPVNVSESNYSGTFTAANGAQSCSGIATISPASGNGPSATFTVTAVAAGNCGYVIADDHGGSVGVAVSVTTTTGTVSGVRRTH